MWLIPTTTTNTLSHLDELLDAFFQTGKSYLSKESGIVFYSQKTKNGYEIMAKVPGFSKENIEVSANDGTLTIKGKRTTDNENDLRKRWLEEEFQKVVSLPSEVNAEEIKAKLEHGVLTVELPLKPETKPKTIEIA